MTLKEAIYRLNVLKEKFKDDSIEVCFHSTANDMLLEPKFKIMLKNDYDIVKNNLTKNDVKCILITWD